MDGIVIIDGLMIGFTALILLVLLVAALRLRARVPMLIQRRLDAEVALRSAAMAAMARDYTAAAPGQRERLALNYRDNRAALLALKPGFDTSGSDASFVPAAVPDRHAA